MGKNLHEDHSTATFIITNSKTTTIILIHINILILLIPSKWVGDTCSDYLSSPMFRSLHRPRYWPKQVGDAIVDADVDADVDFDDDDDLYFATCKKFFFSLRGSVSLY